MITHTKPAPASCIVGPRGEVGFGVFEAPLRSVNLDQARLHWGPVPVPPAIARLRLKQWQHFALVLPEVFIGVAIVDVGYLKVSWCSVVDRATGEHFEHRRMGPHLRVGLARELFDGRCHLSTRGYALEITNRLEEGRHELSIAIEEAPGLPAVHARLTCYHDLNEIQPLVVVLPVGANRGMYSHKVPLPLEGEVRVGDRIWKARREDSVAILDVHKAHYPRHTWWNWATFGGFDPNGRLLAMNLTRNVNLDDTALNENAVWVDGRLHRLGPARFLLPMDPATEPWGLHTDDGAIDLVFTPQGERNENIRLGLIRSVFHQPFGTFEGSVTVEGERLAIDGLFGVCEDHDSIW